MKMKFKVMMRKGHKQQLKELSIPLDSDLTTGLKDTTQDKAKAEDFEEIKQKILESERRQEEEEYQGEGRREGEGREGWREGEGREGGEGRGRDGEIKQGGRAV